MLLLTIVVSIETIAALQLLLERDGKDLEKGLPEVCNFGIAAGH